MSHIYSDNVVKIFFAIISQFRMKIQILRTMRVIMRNWTKMENQSSPKPKGRNWIQLKWFYVVERSAYGTRNEKKFC